MNVLYIHKALHEVLGEKQTVIEVVITILFALLGALLIYWLLFPKDSGVALWALIFGFVLVGDVLAGCIANVTKGTNDYYAARAMSRWVFIGLHFHLVLIAWLLDGPLEYSCIIWFFTISSTVLVNLLSAHFLQLFVSANLLCVGILIAAILALPAWFMVVSVFFMLKLILSFAVDHHKTSRD
ncbi:hypothetical protein ACU6U9_17920 [Pseudomonas sp. HK3]